jgi:hypothetical protein
VGKINNAGPPRERRSDQEGSDTDTEHRSQKSMHGQAERQDLRLHDRRNRYGQKAGPETEHHERHHGMAGDDAGSAAIDPLCCWEPRQATADASIQHPQLRPGFTPAWLEQLGLLRRWE